MYEIRHESAAKLPLAHVVLSKTYVAYSMSMNILNIDTTKGGEKLL